MTEFDVSWEKAVKSVTGDSEKIMQESCKQLFTSIVIDTPVRSGRLRGDWVTNIGSIPDSETGILDPSGLIARSNIESITGEYKLNTDMYFANNASYAEQIEYGSSTQAPYGMVGINVARFDTIVESVARKLVK